MKDGSTFEVFDRDGGIDRFAKAAGLAAGNAALELAGGGLQDADFAAAGVGRFAAEAAKMTLQSAEAGVDECRAPRASPSSRSCVASARTFMVRA